MTFQFKKLSKILLVSVLLLLAISSLCTFLSYQYVLRNDKKNFHKRLDILFENKQRVSSGFFNINASDFYSANSCVQDGKGSHKDIENFVKNGLRIHPSCYDVDFSDLSLYREYDVSPIQNFKINFKIEKGFYTPNLQSDEKFLVRTVEKVSEDKRILATYLLTDFALLTKKKPLDVGENPLIILRESLYNIYLGYLSFNSMTQDVEKYNSDSLFSFMQAMQIEPGSINLTSENDLFFLSIQGSNRNDVFDESTSKESVYQTNSEILTIAKVKKEEIPIYTLQNDDTSFKLKKELFFSSFLYSSLFLVIIYITLILKNILRKYK